MSGQTSPPGKTFNERWPDDVATANYLAGPWVPVALGGLAGIIGAPLLLGAWLGSSWLPWIVFGSALVVLTLLVPRARGGMRMWMLRGWRLAAWTLLAGLLGIVGLLLTGRLCVSEACIGGAGLTPDRLVPGIVVFAVSVLGSTLAAIAVDRAARRFPVR